jgi:hypothetical protein
LKLTIGKLRKSISKQDTGNKPLIIFLPNRILFTIRFVRQMLQLYKVLCIIDAVFPIGPEISGFYGFLKQ